MDTSWTASVPSLALVMPAAPAPPTPTPPSRKISLALSGLSGFFTALLKPRPLASPAPAPDAAAPRLPDPRLLHGVGLLSGAMEPDEADAGTPPPTLTRALADLERFHAGLVAAIDADPEAAAVDAAAVAATCGLAGALMYGAIACALFLDPKTAGTISSGGTTAEQAATAAHTCVNAAFVLLGIATSINPLDLAEPERVLGERDAAVTFIEEAVLASPFPLDRSLNPLLAHARAAAESLTTKTVAADGALAAFHTAAEAVCTLKHLADCVAALPSLPRADGSRNDLDPVLVASAVRCVAVEVAITLMAYETRPGWDDERVWIEETQRHIVALLQGLIGVLVAYPAEETLPLIFAPLDSSMWLAPCEDEEDEPDDSDDDLSEDDAAFDAAPPETTPLLATINALTDRFIEADEGFRRQCPERVNAAGERVDVGRGTVERHFKHLVLTIFHLVKAGKIRARRAACIEGIKAAHLAAASPGGRTKSAKAVAAKRVRAQIERVARGAAAAANAARLVDAARARGRDLTFVAAGKRAKRKLAPEDEEHEADPDVERKCGLEAERELRERGVAQGVLDAVLRPGPLAARKKPRLSGGSSSRQGSSKARLSSEMGLSGRRVSGSSTRASRAGTHDSRASFVP